MIGSVHLPVAEHAGGRGAAPHDRPVLGQPVVARPILGHRVLVPQRKEHTHDVAVDTRNDVLGRRIDLRIFVGR